MTSAWALEIPFIKVEELAEVKRSTGKGGGETGVRTTCTYSYSLSGFRGLSKADTDTCLHWQKDLDERYFDGNSRINSNLVLQDAE